MPCERLQKKNEDQAVDVKKIQKEIAHYQEMVKEATKERKVDKEYHSTGTGEYKVVEKEIEKAGGPHVLYGNWADTSRKRIYPRKEEVQDNYVTYALSDCYKKSDIDVFMNNQLDSYQRAINLFAEYEKMKKEYTNLLKGKF